MVAVFCGWQSVVVFVAADVIVVAEQFGVGGVVTLVGVQNMGDPAISLTVPLFALQHALAASSWPQQKELYPSHKVITASDERKSPNTSG
jgi:hypothetical protein